MCNWKDRVYDCLKDVEFSPSIEKTSCPRANTEKSGGKEEPHLLTMETLVSGLDVPAFLTSFTLNGRTNVIGAPCDYVMAFTHSAASPSSSSDSCSFAVALHSAIDTDKNTARTLGLAKPEARARVSSEPFMRYCK